MNVTDIAGKFSHGREILACENYGNGHINDTCRVSTGSGDFILQRINRRVFHHPDQVMENVLGVTGWIRRKLEACGEDPAGRVLQVIPAEDGAPFFIDEAGEYWRAYEMITGAVCYEQAPTEEVFYESAFAFGLFQRQLCDYPVSALHETIPDFHNTPVRLAQFREAVKRDAAGRLASAQAEVDFLLERSELAGHLAQAAAQGRLPLHVTHNDTKLNNVMMDAKTGKGRCVLDLDTVMPGFSVTDFGDSIRFGASTAAEDEPDLKRVHFDLHLYEVYAGGFIAGCGGALSRDELAMLPDGALVITYEQALRFLTDYLAGDVYYKISRPGHNLERARTQIRLLGEMEQRLDDMRSVIGTPCT